MLPYPEFEYTKDRRNSARVTLADWDDVHYWCDYFDCSEGTLRRAVALVGGALDEVAAYLSDAIPPGFRAE